MEKNISPPTGGHLTASSCFGVLFLIKGGILIKSLENYSTLNESADMDFWFGKGTIMLCCVDANNSVLKKLIVVEYMSTLIFPK